MNKRLSVSSCMFDRVLQPKHPQNTKTDSYQMKSAILDSQRHFHAFREFNFIRHVKAVYLQHFTMAWFDVAAKKLGFPSIELFVKVRRSHIKPTKK